MNTPNFVLLRGLGRYHAHWLDFENELKNIFPDSQIKYLDLPGTGYRNQNTFPDSVEEAAKIIRKDFLEIKKNKEWIPISISMGAMICLSWARQFPEDFSQAIIINASSADCNLLDRVKPKAMATLIRAFAELRDDKREELIYKITSSKPIDPKIISKWVSIHRSFPTKRDTFIKQIYAASKFHLPVGLHQKFLILCSRHDQLCSYKCSFYIKDHTDSTIEMNHEAGHDLPLDDGYWVAKKIQNFISSTKKN